MSRRATQLRRATPSPGARERWVRARRRGTSTLLRPAPSAVRSSAWSASSDEPRAPHLRSALPGIRQAEPAPAERNLQRVRPEWRRACPRIRKDLTRALLPPGRKGRRVYRQVRRARKELLPGGPVLRWALRKGEAPPGESMVQPEPAAPPPGRAWQAPGQRSRSSRGEAIDEQAWRGLYRSLAKSWVFAPLTVPTPAATFRRGEMTERPKVPDSKSGVPARVPWVRIPLSPLHPPRAVPWL